MNEYLGRVVVTLDMERRKDLGAVLHVKVERTGELDAHIQRIIPNNDFESYWDYVWNACKQLLDEALRKEIKNE